MKNPLVECIANYSEARRPEVVEAIAAAITSVGGVRLLDRHSDLDHNRSVLTFIAPPEAVLEAAFRSVAAAADLINMDEHTGGHPRIGAADVLPFVPVQDVSMQDCVELARRLGRRVGDQLNIPVYLYEEAATLPERQNLENIRRGQYEALKVEIGVDPARDPDFGPRYLGTAGATVIGARQPLLAFNVYLNTGDVEIAKKIAKTVRNSSGGFRYVKAMGILVDGRAQVSMNLTNFRSTPLSLVVETIRREAARYGAAIHHSELVGLTPQQALVDAAVWYLQLDQFEPDQILEHHLQETQTTPPGEDLASLSESFVDELAAGTPTPGGGSAAAYAGAMGAALVAMVARLTVGKKKYLAVQNQMQVIIERAEALRVDLQAAVTRDAEAYQAVMAAMKLPNGAPSPDQARCQAIEKATLVAAQVPLEVAQKAVSVLELALEVVAKGNLNAMSDGGSAAVLAGSALRIAGLNVRTNIPMLQDRAAAEQLLADLSALEARAAILQNRIQIQLVERGDLSL